MKNRKFNYKKTMTLLNLLFFTQCTIRIGILFKVQCGNFKIRPFKTVVIFFFYCFENKMSKQKILNSNRKDYRKK